MDYRPILDFSSHNADRPSTFVHQCTNIWQAFGGHNLLEISSADPEVIGLLWTERTLHPDFSSAAHLRLRLSHSAKLAVRGSYLFSSFLTHERSQRRVKCVVAVEAVEVKSTCPPWVKISTYPTSSGKPRWKLLSTLALIKQLFAEGHLTKKATVEKHWIGILIVRRLATVLFENAMKKGTKNWNIIIFKIKLIVLLGVLAIRVGDVCKTKLDIYDL